MAEDIIGIDLGTTNSAVGVVESGFPILLADSSGARITPSAVSYTNNGEVAVGGVALRSRNSGSTVVTSAKRYIGRRYQEVRDEDFCVPLVEVADGGAGFQVGEQRVSPVEVSAEVLKYLKSVAEQQLGRTVEKAVITVPAYFNDSQRNATKQAGEIAGLEVVRIISEPTAAALAYGLDKLDESARVAVYDYGGGTFDVSVLEMRDGVFQVISTSGDTRLGGDDLDEMLAQWCCTQVAGLEYAELDDSERQRLIDAARKLKESLTDEEQSALQIPFFRAGEQVLHDAGGTVDKVILVGGSTRIPAVQRLVQEVFEKEPDVSQHPDEAVALGAVIQGGMLSGALQKMVLLDVTPLSLGIETLGGLMNVIIPRNTTIPCKAGEMFTNAIANQKSMRVRVLQGEREMARDNWELGHVDVAFKPANKGQARVGVQFSIDENGILEVLTRDVESGKDTILEINMVSESVDYAFDDMAERVFTEAKLKAEELLPAVRSGLAQVGDDMEAEDLKDIQEAEQVVRRLLDEQGSANELKAAVQKLDKATEHMAAILVEKAMEAALMRKLGE